MVGHILGLAEGCDGALQVSRVPQDDGGDEQVEAGGTVLLVLGKRRGGGTWRVAVPL